MGHGIAVPKMRGPTARRLLAAEEGSHRRTYDALRASGAEVERLKRALAAEYVVAASLSAERDAGFSALSDMVAVEKRRADEAEASLAVAVKSLAVYRAAEEE